MAPLVYVGCRKVLLLFVILFFFVSFCFSVCSEPQLKSKELNSISGGRRRMLELKAEENEEYEQPLKKKSTKNQTKLIKPPSNLSLKNQTKTIKSNNLNSTKNQTKLSSKTTLTDTSLKKLNSTTFKTKKLNSTNSSKPSNSVSTSIKTSLDLAKASGGGAKAKNKTTKATATKDKDKDKQTNNKFIKEDQTEPEKPNIQNKKLKAPPSWLFEEEDDDLISGFKDLPIKFKQTLIPDLERISTTSKAYITKANKEITKGFKPYVGNKYAPTIATSLSFAFVLIPLVFISLLFNRIKAYFSLQKLLIFIQAYLSIYFFILCLSSLITGLEPLRFFYSTSQTTYLCLQVLQTLAYVLYLLLLLMYLLLVFSTDCGLGSKFLGLAQSFVGFSVGLHYYMTVFHRVVLRQPPKTNWKIHGIYATCFFLICLIAGADRRKKTYLEEGGEEGKKN
ncbi:uncharacterized protein LOC133283715 [Gastrolobium bilobum]|uniref:uncharacterized protein LOC133283715 n=1 Tax=Gastrolobium bilobum TaxID=150636 RepID=UPI002AB227CD|nr:uncharacterized protein LOC133283715 [Gastrolobium bilobum]